MTQRCYLKKKKKTKHTGWGARVACARDPLSGLASSILPEFQLDGSQRYTLNTFTYSRREKGRRSVSRLL